MKMFCRHCWKKVELWIGKNAEHVEARCQECGGWIKFLSGREAREIAIASLRTNCTPKPPIRQPGERNRQPAASTTRPPAVIRPQPS